MKYPFLVFYGFLLVSAGSWASIPEVFRKSFYDSYRVGQCGLNVLNFFERLDNEGEDISGLSMVYVENKGSSVFGMINAERARARVNGQWGTDEKNWYHHQFAMDKNGMVYDFDYSSAPKLTPFKNYVEDMFLNEDECLNPKPAEFCGGRKEKLNDYYLKFYDASGVIEGNPPSYWSGSLSQALEKIKN